jgi:DNA-binding NarL/FixJ family response regulator
VIALSTNLRPSAGTDAPSAEARNGVPLTVIRVLLAYHEELIRSGLRSLLQTIGGIQIVGEAEDGVSAVRIAMKSRPDVVLMDLHLPHLDGANATAQVAKVAPGARVLLLADPSDEAVVVRALRVGARGYLLKRAGPQELALAIQAVARGETYLGPGLAETVLAHFSENGGHNEGDRLTLRQREIVQLIVEGRTSKEIAQLLDLSVKTVYRHRAMLMNRLEVHSVVHLMRWAMQAGIGASRDPASPSAAPRRRP